MKIINDFKIGSKLNLLFAFFLISFIIFGIFTYSGLNRIKVNGPIYNEIVQGKDLIADILPPPEYIIESYLNCMEISDQAEQSKSLKEMQPLFEKAETLKKEYDQRHEFWAQNLPEGEVKALMVDKAYQYAIDFYNVRDNEYIPAIKANDLQKAKDVLRGKLSAAYQNHRNIIDQIVTKATLQNSDTEQAAKTELISTSVLLIVICVSSSILTLILGLAITRSISKPLKTLVKMAGALSEGDLLRDFPEDQKRSIRFRRDEIGDVGKAFDNIVDYLQDTADAANKIAKNDLTISVKLRSPKDELRTAFSLMVQSLHNSMGQVTSNANKLQTKATQLASVSEKAGIATGKIAQTFQMLSTGILQESKAIEIANDSLGQMTDILGSLVYGAHDESDAVQKAAMAAGDITSIIVDVVENTQSVYKNVDIVLTAANNGADRVKMTIGEMESIREKVGMSAKKVAEMGQHSEQITTIVEAIDDIASQTNLLALNAAIEAARAGEYGKGFAVVADEVRKLAEKASLSAKEIANLIGGIQLTVKEAMETMNEGTKEVETGVNMVNQAGSALQRILETTQALTDQTNETVISARKMNTSSSKLTSLVSDVSDTIEKNTLAMQKMKSSSLEVTRAIENITTVNNETSSSIEIVTFSSQEIKERVDDVATSAEDLSSMALSLNTLVRQFILT
jgi:methyl-accepting chemotaxis protein